MGDIMSKKDDFKEFVRKNPSLIEHVKDDKMTWQKFYEMWDLYGEDNKIWDDYRSAPSNTTKTAETSAFWTSILSGLKNMNVDTVRKNIDGIQKAVGFFQDLNTKDGDRKDTYEPRPLYRKFED